MSSFFCISLDFEKKWGVLDKDIPDYDLSIENVPEVIARLLNLFEENGIHCTWAFVGALLVRTEEQLKGLLSNSRYLTYHNRLLNPKFYFRDYAFNERLFSGYHELVSIKNTPGQELASHSFYHTYYNELGISKNALTQESELFDKFSQSMLDVICQGIVFPRNQVPDDLSDMTYSYYRSNLDNIFDRGYSETELNLFNRSLRLLDSIIPLRYFRSCTPKFDKNNKLSIPATRFLRPQTKSRIFNALHLSRIKNEMTWAAKNNDFFHLWWHPHNFGADVEKNISNLEVIISHFKQLEACYGMQSYNMSEIYHNFNGVR